MRKRKDIEKIYEAALTQFAKSGYQKATLEDIAGMLNMTNANLYCYASSKRELYHDSVAYALTKWQNKVYESIKDIEDPKERLITLCDSAVYYLSNDKKFCSILKNDPEIFPMFPTVDPYEEINSRSSEMLEKTIDEGVAAGVFNKVNAKYATHFLFASYKEIIIEGYIRSYNKDFMKTYNEMKNIILNGLIK